MSGDSSQTEEKADRKVGGGRKSFTTNREGPTANVSEQFCQQLPALKMVGAGGGGGQHPFFLPCSVL